jgi:hypothetical protein
MDPMSLGGDLQEKVGIPQGLGDEPQPMRDSGLLQQRVDSWCWWVDPWDRPVDACCRGLNPRCGGGLPVEFGGELTAWRVDLSSHLVDPRCW